MATKKNQDVQVLEIPSIEIRDAVISVEGDTPLIMHKWSEKAKKEMLDLQTKKPKAKGKEARDPEAEYVDTIYFLDGEPEERTAVAVQEAVASGARIGFPSTAFKACAIMGAYRSGIGIKTTEMRAAFHIPEEFVEIKGVPNPREDMVKIGGISKVAYIRFRAEFRKWKADIHVKYNAGVITLAQLANLFNLGGFACGVGEWRPERNGTMGSFHVVGATEL